MLITSDSAWRMQQPEEGRRKKVQGEERKPRTGSRRVKSQELGQNKTRGDKRTRIRGAPLENVLQTSMVGRKSGLCGGSEAQGLGRHAVSQ